MTISLFLIVTRNFFDRKSSNLLPIFTDPKNKIPIMKLLLYLFVIFSFFSCTTEKPIADLLMMNAKVYTVNENFEISEAFTVKDGKIQEVGNTADLKMKYRISETLDAEGKTIYPGFIDAHAHLYKLGLYYQNVELIGTISYEEVLDRVVAFQKEKNVDFIEGRGWDQNDWENKINPT